MVRRLWVPAGEQCPEIGSDGDPGKGKECDIDHPPFCLFRLTLLAHTSALQISQLAIEVGWVKRDPFCLISKVIFDRELRPRVSGSLAIQVE